MKLFLLLVTLTYPPDEAQTFRYGPMPLGRCTEEGKRAMDNIHLVAPDALVSWQCVNLRARSLPRPAYRDEFRDIGPGPHKWEDME